MNINESDPWSLLDAELDAWHKAGQSAGLWWRDDDAAIPGPKLDQLISVSMQAGLLLAVIPAKSDKSLRKSLSQSSLIRIAQHGYAHINHAPRGQGLGAWELGMHRGLDAVLADLDAGRSRLAELFDDYFLPVVVPPWNRIDSALFKPLVDRGYQAVSTFGARQSQYWVDGLLAVNAHCDPIRWKTGAKFAGDAKTLTQLVEHLSARRLGDVDAEEPTGFLTHHIDLDNDGWQFCERLATSISRHPGAHWVPPADVFRNPL